MAAALKVKGRTDVRVIGQGTAAVELIEETGGLAVIGQVTAEVTVRAIQDAVRDASPLPIRDDATVMVLRVPPGADPTPRGAA